MTIQKQTNNQEKKEQERFNNITQSNKVENQNQTHNSKKEGLGKNIKR